MNGTRAGSFARGLVIFAALVVVVAGLRAGGTILLPLLLATFLTVLSAPSVLWLERRGMRPGLAVALAMVVLIAVLAVFVALLTTSVRGFDTALPGYEDAFGVLLHNVREATQWLPFEMSDAVMDQAVEPASMIAVLSLVATGVIAALSNTALVLLAVVFMLLEVAGLPRKLRLAMDAPGADLGPWAKAVRQVQRYLAIKTIISLATGALVGLWCALWGVDFPILWGLVAFMLNYVPNVGSIVAAIGPVLLALVQPGLGVGIALLVAVGYLVVNMVLGNLLEPMWMGRRFGLSPLVVFLSLLVWGFVWGPVGMLLSVPLTMVVRIVLEQWPETHWLFVLLGPAPDPDLRPHPSEPPPG